MIRMPELKTGVMGGVEVPAREELLAMREDSYILRAREGELTRVPAEKCLLPHDPKANPQAIYAARSPDGAVYVRLASLMCRSTDGGQTWGSYEIPEEGHCFQVLSDATFVGFGAAEREGKNGCVPVVSSPDEGRSWRRISEIALPPKHSGGIYAMYRFADDMLVCGVAAGDHVFEDGEYVSGGGYVDAYQSADGGVSWEGPSDRICEWGSEGGIAGMASGKVLAVIRYQRPLLPNDPPDLVERNGGMPGWPYKNVFLVDSRDRGRTWENFRQLTTVFGQTRGWPAALSDGTVVVVHDTRYGPGSPGSRAMISRDEGDTWEDEVYYLDCTTFTGSYNASVVLEDDLILTVAGTSDAGNDWDVVLDHTDFTAIRWRPIKA